MDIKGYIKQYLDDSNLMQLASVSGNKPWVCTVYYVRDDELNLYWISLPTRRHSQDLATNPNAAVAIAAKHDQPIVGVQAEGVVSIVEDEYLIKSVMEAYVKKYNTGHKFYENFVAGVNQQHLYKLKPSEYVLFDELNFKDNPRHQLPLN